MLYGFMCYANVMSTRRITISVPVDVARRMKRAAASKSVRAWVTEVIEDRLDDAALEQAWADFYRDVAPSAEDVRRADAVFKSLVRPAQRKSVA